MKRLAVAGFLAVLSHAGLLLLNLQTLFPKPSEPPPRQVLIDLIETPPPRTLREKVPEPLPRPKPLVRPEPPKISPIRPVENPPAATALPAPVAVADDPEVLFRSSTPPVGKTRPDGKPVEDPLPVRPALGPAPIVREAVPLYRNNPPPAYPALARKRGYEGTVILEVFVSRKGLVTDQKIHQSSGYALLDEAALTTVKDWQFNPGKKGETPVDMWVRVPIRFNLKN